MSLFHRLLDGLHGTWKNHPDNLLSGSRKALKALDSGSWFCDQKDLELTQRTLVQLSEIVESRLVELSLCRDEVSDWGDST